MPKMVFRFLRLNSFLSFLSTQDKCLNQILLYYWVPFHWVSYPLSTSSTDPNSCPKSRKEIDGKVCNICRSLGFNILLIIDCHNNWFNVRTYCLDKGVNGLYNYGNQCFINAILQSLSSLKSMDSWLNYANGLHNERKNSLTFSLLNTINGKTIEENYYSF